MRGDGVKAEKFLLKKEERKRHIPSGKQMFLRHSRAVASRVVKVLAYRVDRLKIDKRAADREKGFVRWVQRYMKKVDSQNGVKILERTWRNQADTELEGREERAMETDRFWRRGDSYLFN